MQSHFSGTDVPSSVLSTVATFPPLEDPQAGMTLSITLSQHLSPRGWASCSLQFVSVAQDWIQIHFQAYACHMLWQWKTCCCEKLRRRLCEENIADWPDTPHDGEGPKHRRGKTSRAGKSTLSVLGPGCFTLVRLMAVFCHSLFHFCLFWLVSSLFTMCPGSYRAHSLWF